MYACDHREILYANGWAKGVEGAVIISGNLVFLM
jgi:hypothetical protein